MMTEAVKGSLGEVRLLEEGKRRSMDAGTYNRNGWCNQSSVGELGCAKAKSHPEWSVFVVCTAPPATFFIIHHRSHRLPSGAEVICEPESE
jgi:hypothetical protein